MYNFSNLQLKILILFILFLYMHASQIMFGGQRTTFCTSTSILSQSLSSDSG